MKIYYTYKAAKDLENLPLVAQKRITKKMRFYAKQKDPLKFEENLTESREGEFRFRVGDHRVIFDVMKKQIIILVIRKRDKAYN